MRRSQRKLRACALERRVALAAAVVALSPFASSPARAQQDVAQPRPNLMLLLDNSGSMELMMNGQTMEAFASGVAPSTVPATQQKAQPCDGTPWPYPNRWTVEMEALTGQMAQFACLDEPRTAGSPFDKEYSDWGGQSPLWGGTGAASAQVHPYDLDYYIDFHRPVEPLGDGNVCVVAANQGPSGWSTANSAAHHNTAADFSLAGIGGYEYVPLAPGTASSSIRCGDTGAPAGACLPSWTGAATPVTCTFGQGSGGLIDQGGPGVRFGLMTIDSDTLPNTGVSGAGTSSWAEVATSTGVVPPVDLTTGMWSYFNGWTSATPPNFNGSSLGRPTGCLLGDPGNGPVPFFEVGARNPDAPPWEGPLIGFPSTTTLSPDPDPSSNNSQIELAIRAMHPYGANPIAGLLDDAKYYFWLDPNGDKTDALLNCRPNYIVLLTHSAPNLDLQPYCRQALGAPDGGAGDTGSSTAGQGICPYDVPENVAAGLYAGSYSPVGGNAVPNTGSTAATSPASGVGRSIETFVVGFAMSSTLCGPGTAFPTCSVGATETCNDVLTPPGGPYTGVDAVKCGTPGNTGTAGPEYAQCCQLAKIAAAGGTSVPYFADSQADLNKALSAILSIVLQSASTRAIPVELQQSANTTTTGGANSAIFVSSFNASRSVAWSGDVQRERYQCVWANGAWTQQTQTIDPANTAGDDFQKNLDTAAASRYAMLVYPSGVVTSDWHIAAQLALRPYVNGPGAGTATGQALDGLNMNDGGEYVFAFKTAGANQVIATGAPPPSTSFGPPFAADALFGSGSCPINVPGTSIPFSSDDCAQIAFNYLYGASNGPPDWPSTFSPFPARYAGTTSGALALPSSAFGGVYHSTPAVAVPPAALIQDDAYQAYVQTYAQAYTQYQSTWEPRHTMLYVATMDGLLHAFGVDYSADNYTFNGLNANGKMNELWSFVPPAALAHVIDGFPTAQTPVLDGSPVVKDTVYQRSSVGTATDWHTSLVAGMGPSGSIGIGGYYAMDVTDPIVNDASTGSTHHAFATQGATNGLLAVTTPHSATNQDLPPYMNTSLTPPSNVPPQGPHFLWQLTGGGALPSGSSNPLSPIFAKYSGTPAITTVYVADPDDGNSTKREIGVAILPGGSDATSPPVSGAVCPRLPKVLSQNTSISAYDLSTQVRDWSKNGDCGLGDTPGQSVNGRSLSIVRLDTGEILRTFANFSQQCGTPPCTNDLPPASAAAPSAVMPLFSPPGGGANVAVTNSQNAAGYAVHGRITDARFDSPITGTPVPFPNDVGSIAQRIFVSDEDGTIWRVDVSSTDPSQWWVEPFWDSFNEKVRSVAGTNEVAWAQQKTPLIDPIAISVGRFGNLVLNFGTGDVSNLGKSVGGTAYVYSVAEINDPSLGRLDSRVNWWKALSANPGEFMSGPGAVFDSVYYYATFVPPSTSISCSPGEAWIWGVDYENATDTTLLNSAPPPTPASSSFTYDPPSNGGAPKLVDTNGALKQELDTGQAAVLPGIAVTNTASCATTDTVTDQYTGGSRLDLQNVSQSQYSVSALVGGKAGTTAAPQASTTNAGNVGQFNYALANGVRSGSLVDSWASIVE